MNGWIVREFSFQLLTKSVTSFSAESRMCPGPNSLILKKCRFDLFKLKLILRVVATLNAWDRIVFEVKMNRSCTSKRSCLPISLLCLKNRLQDSLVETIFEIRNLKLPNWYSFKFYINTWKYKKDDQSECNKNSHVSPR